MSTPELAEGQSVRTVSTTNEPAPRGTVLEVFADRRAPLAYVDFGDGRPSWVFAASLEALPELPDQSPDDTLRHTA